MGDNMGVAVSKTKNDKKKKKVELKEKKGEADTVKNERAIDKNMEFTEIDTPKIINDNKEDEIMKTKTTSSTPAQLVPQGKEPISQAKPFVEKVSQERAFNLSDEEKESCNQASMQRVESTKNHDKTKNEVSKKDKPLVQHTEHKSKEPNKELLPSKVTGDKNEPKIKTVKKVEREHTLSFSQKENINTTAEVELSDFT